MSSAVCKGEAEFQHIRFFQCFENLAFVSHVIWLQEVESPFQCILVVLRHFLNFELNVPWLLHDFSSSIAFNEGHVLVSCYNVLILWIIKAVISVKLFHISQNLIEMHLSPEMNISLERCSALRDEESEWIQHITFCQCFKNLALFSMWFDFRDLILSVYISSFQTLPQLRTNCIMSFALFLPKHCFKSLVFCKDPYRQQQRINWSMTLEKKIWSNILSTSTFVPKPVHLLYYVGSEDSWNLINGQAFPDVFLPDTYHFFGGIL